MMHSTILAGNKEFTLVNIIDALYEAEFAAAHWERLGLQLKRPPAQLTNIEYEILMACLCLSVLLIL